MRALVLIAALVGIVVLAQGDAPLEDRQASPTEPASPGAGGGGSAGTPAPDAGAIGGAQTAGTPDAGATGGGAPAGIPEGGTSAGAMGGATDAGAAAAVAADAGALTPEEIAEGKDADVEPVTPEQIRDLQSQLEEQRAALQQTQQELQNLQSRIRQDEEELATAPVRSANKVAQVKQETNAERIARLERAMQHLAELQGQILAGETDINASLSSAATELSGGARGTGTWGSAEVAKEIVLALGELNQLAPLIETRNYELAQITVSRAALHAGNALSMARSAASTAR